MVINIFSKRDINRLSEELNLFEHVESGTNYNLDEQFITCEREKVQDTEETK